MLPAWSRLLPLPALAGLIMLAGARQPDTPFPATAAGGQVEVEANSLRIEPGVKQSYLRFDSGVRVSGEGFSLRAETVEIDIAVESLLDTSTMRLPKLDKQPERVIADPGAAVQQMAKEIRGPSTKLEPNAIRRIAASGGVKIEGPGLSLSTATLYSSDGGRSWSTGGRAELKLSDSKRGQSGSFSADLMSVNTAAQTLLARGSLRGTLQQQGEDPIQLVAGQLQADLKRNSVEVSGGLQVTMGNLTLRTTSAGKGKEPPLRINLADKQVALDGGFELSDSAQGIELSGSGLSGGLGDGQQVRVSKGVKLSDSTRGFTLDAERLSAVLEPLQLTAAGKVHLQYGKSSYEALEAVVTRSGEGQSAKYVVEIKGPQTGRIDIEELRRTDEAASQR